jgi:hypothetical protein
MMGEHGRAERDEQQSRIAVHPIPVVLVEPRDLREGRLARRLAVDLFQDGVKSE